MKKYFYILLFFNIHYSTWAQQDPLFSQYMFDRLIINPGVAGSSNIVTGTLTYKKQFIGIEGASETQIFTFQAPIQTKFMGVGFKVVHDKIGVSNQTFITGIYSYHIGFANGKLSLGLEGGISSQSIDFAGLKRKDQSFIQIKSRLKHLKILKKIFK